MLAPISMIIPDFWNNNPLLQPNKMHYTKPYRLNYNVKLVLLPIRLHTVDQLSIVWISSKEMWQRYVRWGVLPAFGHIQNPRWNAGFSTKAAIFRIQVTYNSGNFSN